MYAPRQSSFHLSIFVIIDLLERDADMKNQIPSCISFNAVGTFLPDGQLFSVQVRDFT